jgi:hypothetical protein
MIKTFKEFNNQDPYDGFLEYFKKNVIKEDGEVADGITGVDNIAIPETPINIIHRRKRNRINKIK